jgi:hypothetical protein
MAVQLGTDPNVPVGRTTEVTSIVITTFLTRANNLSDVADAAEARANLGISTGTYLLIANDLSDVNDRATALGNLTLDQVEASGDTVQLNHATNRRAITHDQGLYLDRDILRKFPSYDMVKKLDTEARGHQTLPMNMQTMGGQAWYHEGTYRRVYFTFMGRLNWNAPIEYITNYISYYDLDTGEMATPVDVGVDRADLVDVHLMAFVFVSDDGYVHVTHETGKAGTAWDSNTQHNTNIVHKISDSPEDISSFTRTGLITNGTESYPKYWKFANGNIYGIYRNNGQNSVAIHYSDDDGANWKDMAGSANTTTEICRITNGDGYAYNMQVPGLASDGINIMVMDYDRAASDSIDNLYFLHSDDGIVWENIQSWKGTGSGEFSKNIVSSGYITNAELDSNFRVPPSATMPEKWNVRCGSIAPSGMPILQYALENTTTGRVDEVYISTWNGTAWDHLDIRQKVWPNEILSRGEGSLGKGHSIIPYSDTQWDMFISYIPDGRGVPINDDSCMNYGNMTGDLEPTQSSVFVAQRYMVVATNGVGGIPAAYNVGDIFNCLDNGALDTNNVVKPIRMGMKVLRTYDAGVSWHTVKEWKSSSPFGMGRAGTMNPNFMDSGKFFQFMGDSVSSDNIYPDASDIIMVHDNIYDLM